MEIIESKIEKEELIKSGNFQIKLKGDETVKSLNQSYEESKEKKIYREKSKLINNLRMLTLSLGLYLFGYYLVITNVMGVILTKEIYKMEEKESLKRIGDFGSLISLGGFLSILLTGYLTNKFGRIKLITFLELISTIACFLHSIKSMPLLLVLRFITGFIGGLNLSLMPPLIMEILPKRLGPIGANMCYSFMVIFMLLASLMNYFYGGDEGLLENWKLVLSIVGFIGAFRFIMLLLLFFGLESPVYLVDRYFKDKDCLKKKLLKCLGRIYLEKEAIRKTNDMINEEIEKMKENKKNKREKIKLKVLFKRKYRKRFIIGIILCIFQHLSGLSFLFFFSTQLFDEISNNGALMTLLLSCGNCFASFLAIIVIHMGIGRKFGLSLASILIVLSHIGMIFGIVFKIGWLCSLFILTFIIAFGAGLGSILGVFLVELLPTYGVGIAVSFQFLTSTIIGNFSPWFLTLFGVEVILGFFAVCTFGCFCFIRIFVAETKGMSHQKIVETYMVKDK